MDKEDVLASLRGHLVAAAVVHAGNAVAWQRWERRRELLGDCLRAKAAEEVTRAYHLLRCEAALRLNAAIL